MKTFFQCVVCFLCLLPVVYAENSVTLTNKSGKAIKAFLVAADAKSVTLKMDDARRKEFTIPLNSLSAASVQKIKAWKSRGGGLSTDFGIHFKSGKVSTLSTKEDYDDRTLRLRPEVTIENKDSRLKSGKQVVSLVLFGKSVTDSRAYYVFLKESKPLGAIEPFDDLVVKFSDVRIDYDDRGYARYGSRYHGYAVLVHNGKGQLMEIKAVPTTMEKHGVHLLKLQAQAYFDRSLQSYSPR